MLSVAKTVHSSLDAGLRSPSLSPNINSDDAMLQLDDVPSGLPHRGHLPEQTSHVRSSPAPGDHCTVRDAKVS